MALKIRGRAEEPKAEQPKCPNCGSTLVYDIEKGTLTCRNCGSRIDLGTSEDQTISGFDFEDVESHAMQENAENIPVYYCNSCGAEVLAAKEAVSLTCPYCRNNIILTDKVSGKLRPHAVIPFKFKADALPEKLNRFYQDKVLLPKDFFSNRTLGKITGIYVPFWSFSGEVAGDLSYSGEIVNVSRSGDEEVTVTNEYRLLRNASVSFQDLLLDASEKMDDAAMDSIMPFDLSEAKPFQMEYLAGFAADRFDVKSGTLSERAEARMRTSACRAAGSKATAGYTNARLVGSALSAKMSDVKYLLLPVYVFDIRYDGTEYHYAVNGQTGKIVGGVPIGRDACRRYQGIRAAVVFAAVMLIGIITYFLGV